MITENEKKVLRMLFIAFDLEYSINQIARECNLAPNGALKILRKFEKAGILKSKKIANIKSYRLDYENEKTSNVIMLALIPELEGRLKFRFSDLKDLNRFTKACIIFGSYIESKKEPEDLDILFIIDKKNFNDFKKQSQIVYKTIPIKVHDVLQTKEDFISNLKKRDKVLLDILKKGVIFWGFDEIISTIKNEYKR